METEKNKQKWELKNNQKRAIREILAIIIPVLICTSVVLIARNYVEKNLRYLPRVFDLWEFIFHEITYPDVILAVMIKIALALTIGFPIGFFSSKKLKYIILGVDIAVILIIWYLFIGFENFQNYSKTEIAYMIIDPLVFTATLILGYIAGAFLAKDIWVKITNHLNEKQT